LECTSVISKLQKIQFTFRPVHLFVCVCPALAAELSLSPEACSLISITLTVGHSVVFGVLKIHILYSIFLIAFYMEEMPQKDEAKAVPVSI
jgi:hypothetical protein